MTLLERQRFASCLLFTITAALWASSGTAEETATPAASEIQRLVRERLDAYARRDAVGWARYVDEE